MDDSIVVVAKPSGLLVHRSAEARGDRRFLLQDVRDQIGEHLYPVHRLDRAASGVVLLARTRAAVAAWHGALGEPTTVKVYLALVRGVCPAPFTMDRPLTSDKGIVQAARTDFEPIAGWSHCTLLRARLHSGRRHQIRRHLAHAAHHILGDTTYGKGGDNRRMRTDHGLARMFLHAKSLTIRHPQTNNEVTFDCPLPDDLRAVLVSLESPAALLAEL